MLLSTLINTGFFEKQCHFLRLYKVSIVFEHPVESRFQVSTGSNSLFTGKTRQIKNALPHLLGVEMFNALVLLNKSNA